MSELKTHEFAERLFGYEAVDLNLSRRFPFIFDFRIEVLRSAISLNNLGVIAGGEIHPSPPEHCDFCGELFCEKGLFLEGTVNPSSPRSRVNDTELWASMCVTCYEREGQGLGWGVGQLYRYVIGGDGKRRWQLIAGGNPINEEDAD